MEIINVNPCDNSDVLVLGRRGENLARQIVFDVSQWELEYGAGIVVLLNQRLEDKNPYPISIAQTCNKIRWLITGTDTAQAGKYGRLELRYYIGATLVKSRVWKTIVEKSLDVPGYDPGDPGTVWGEQILAAGASAKADADRAEKSASEAAKSAEHAEQQAAAGGYWDVEINDAGHAIVTRTPNIVEGSEEDGEPVVTDVGPITAYSDAREKGGYTGTREEFASDLANAANYAAESKENATSAAESAERAEQVATQLGYIDLLLGTDGEEDEFLIYLRTTNVEGLDFEINDNEELVESWRTA